MSFSWCYTVSLSWAYANFVWFRVCACALFWQRIRVKLAQSRIAIIYLHLLSTVYQHCADVGSGVQPQRHGQEELRGHSHAIEGCSRVSRVTCHASRVTPWYVSPAWHWNGPAVLVAAQDNDGASKAGKRRDQGRSWTPFFCFRRLEFYNIDVNVHQYSQYSETASTSVVSWLNCLKLGCLSKKSWSCLSMTSMKALVGALNKDEALIGTFPNYC